MIQKIKKIFLTALLCMSFGLLLPVAAHAEVTQQELAAVRQMAEQNLLAVTGFDDQTLQQYIDQFDAQKNTVLASGLRSWQALKQEIGGFASLDGTEIRESEEGYLAELQISCETQRTATVMIGFDRMSGNIMQFSFNKNETLQEKLTSAALNLLVGMGTVFLVLIFIAFLISRFKYINQWVTAKEAREREEKEYAAQLAAVKKLPGSARNVSKRISPEAVRAAVIPADASAELIEADAEPELPAEAKDSPDAQTVAVLTAAVAAAQESDPQLIAVITAAIMAAQCEAGEDPGPDGLVVRSIRRASGRSRNK